MTANIQNDRMQDEKHTHQMLLSSPAYLSAKPKRVLRKRRVIKPPVFNSYNERIYCICKDTDNGSLMVQCDLCEDWFHSVCLALTSDDVAAMSKYHCAECSGMEWPAALVAAATSDSGRAARTAAIPNAAVLDMAGQPLGTSGAASPTIINGAATLPLPKMSAMPSDQDVPTDSTTQHDILPVPESSSASASPPLSFPPSVFASPSNLLLPSISSSCASSVLSSVPLSISTTPLPLDPPFPTVIAVGKEASSFNPTTACILSDLSSTTLESPNPRPGSVVGKSHEVKRKSVTDGSLASVAIHPTKRVRSDPKRTKSSEDTVSSALVATNTLRASFRKNFTDIFRDIYAWATTHLAELGGVLHPSIHLDDYAGFAEKTELALFEATSFVKNGSGLAASDQYKAKFRSLRFNLMDDQNLRLRRRLLTKCSQFLDPATLVRLSPEELGNQEIQESMGRVKLESLRNSFKPCDVSHGVTKKTHKGDVEIGPVVSPSQKRRPVVASREGRGGSAEKGYDGRVSQQPVLDRSATGMRNVDITHMSISSYRPGRDLVAVNGGSDEASLRQQTPLLPTASIASDEGGLLQRHESGGGSSSRSGDRITTIPITSRAKNATLDDIIASMNCSIDDNVNSDTIYNGGSSDVALDGHHGSSVGKDEGELTISNASGSDIVMVDGSEEGRSHAKGSTTGTVSLRSHDYTMTAAEYDAAGGDKEDSLTSSSEGSGVDGIADSNGDGKEATVKTKRTDALLRKGGDRHRHDGRNTSKSTSSSSNSNSNSSNHLSVLWQGQVSMPLVGKFSGIARQVCGPWIGQQDAWLDILSPSIEISGRIPHERVHDYLHGRLKSGSCMLVGIEFVLSSTVTTTITGPIVTGPIVTGPIVTGPIVTGTTTTTTTSDQTGLDSLIDYFISRDRYAVVSNHYVSVKDMYLVPLKGSLPVPSVLQSVPGGCRIPPSSCNRLFGLLLLAKEYIPKGVSLSANVTTGTIGTTTRTTPKTIGTTPIGTTTTTTPTSVEVSSITKLKRQNGQSVASSHSSGSGRTKRVAISDSAATASTSTATSGTLSTAATAVGEPTVSVSGSLSATKPAVVLPSLAGLSVNGTSNVQSTLNELLGSSAITMYATAAAAAATTTTTAASLPSHPPELQSGYSMHTGSVSGTTAQDLASVMTQQKNTGHYQPQPLLNATTGINARTNNNVNPQTAIPTLPVLGGMLGTAPSTPDMQFLLAMLKNTAATSSSLPNGGGNPNTFNTINTNLSQFDLGGKAVGSNGNGNGNIGTLLASLLGDGSGESSGGHTAVSMSALSHSSMHNPLHAPSQSDHHNNGYQDSYHGDSHFNNYQQQQQQHYRYNGNDGYHQQHYSGGYSNGNQQQAHEPYSTPSGGAPIYGDNRYGSSSLDNAGNSGYRGIRGGRGGRGYSGAQQPHRYNGGLRRGQYRR
ncbi:hypothetical protein BASA83_000206 [Batrachochytrium salamandrivorans]|nr:hypothetical protein BASA83_000206 [Batrachochytrium salamandrivorans]